METPILNIPVLKKLNVHEEKAAKLNQREQQLASALPSLSCCTPKNETSVCCSPSQSKEENKGACCAQPEDGSACCNK